MGVSNLEPETQRLVATLECYLREEMSGWNSKNTIPHYRSIRKWFEDDARDQGIPYKEFRELYEAAMARVRAQLSPAEPVIRDPIGHVDAARLAELVAADPDCIDGYMLGSVAVMEYQHGFQEIHPGEPEPFWFAKDDPVV